MAITKGWTKAAKKKNASGTAVDDEEIVLVIVKSVDRLRKSGDRWLGPGVQREMWK